MSGSTPYKCHIFDYPSKFEGLYLALHAILFQTVFCFTFLGSYMFITRQKVNENSTSAFNYWNDFSWAECIGFMTRSASKFKFGKRMCFVDVYIWFWKFQEVQQSCKIFTIYSLYVHCMFYEDVMKLHRKSFELLLVSRVNEEWPSVSRVWLFYLHSKNRPIPFPRSRQAWNEISASLGQFGIHINRKLFAEVFHEKLGLRFEAGQLVPCKQVFEYQKYEDALTIVSTDYWKAIQCQLH